MLLWVKLIAGASAKSMSLSASWPGPLLQFQIRSQAPFRSSLPGTLMHFSGCAAHRIAPLPPSGITNLVFSRGAFSQSQSWSCEPPGASRHSSGCWAHWMGPVSPGAGTMNVSDVSPHSQISGTPNVSFLPIFTSMHFHGRGAQTMRTYSSEIASIRPVTLSGRARAGDVLGAQSVLDRHASAPTPTRQAAGTNHGGRGQRVPVGPRRGARVCSTSSSSSPPSKTLRSDAPDVITGEAPCRGPNWPADGRRARPTRGPWSEMA
mmetsp:Transcript_113630/g.321766  ORF Transcript_113630/g.321766 Transcript_113630/m.321766 type:complete len:263 (-) Transcript_113630:3-791(-)